MFFFTGRRLVESWRADLRAVDRRESLHRGGRQEHAGRHLKEDRQRGTVDARIPGTASQGFHPQAAGQGSKEEIG